LTQLSISSLLPHLIANNVITVDEKKVIEMKERNELKGMDHFLTDVIIKSLKFDIKEIYKRFLLSMEQHGGEDFKRMAEKLGK